MMSNHRHPRPRHKRIETELARANRALRLVSGSNLALVRIADEAAVLQEVCRLAVEVGGYRMAWVGWAEDDEHRTVRPVAQAGFESGYLESARITWADEPYGRGPTGTAIRSGQPTIARDILADPAFEPWREAAMQGGYRSSIAVPLHDGSRAFGALCIYAAEVDSFDGEEVEVLTELANDLAFGLAVLRTRAERQRTADALEESRWKLEEAQRIAHVGHWERALDTDEITWSDETYRIFGLEPQERRLGLPEFLEFIHPEDRARVAQSIDEAWRGVRRYEAEYRIVRPDGETRFIHSQGDLIRDESGRPRRAFGVLQDVTEWRQLEERYRHAQKMEAVGQLAGGIAHDFNNILAAIIMQAGMAVTVPDLPPEAAELLRDIQASAERAVDLTRQLLLLSHKQVMHRRTLDLNELVAAMARLLQRLLPANVHLQLSLHPEPLVLLADPGMLDMVILNLAVNARDAMPGGGPVVIETGEKALTPDEARTMADVAPGRYVRLRVRDAGGGIPPEHFGQIFDPFFTTKEPGQGTGLGLATVFGVISQHQGTIRVSSEVGRGTTFEVLLPAADNGSIATSRDAADTTTRGGTETILLVEDDSALRTTTRSLLERQGYQVLSAENGAEALRLWEQQRGRVALLLTDVAIPGWLSGHDLATQLQARQPGLKVVFTSGYRADIAGRELRLEEGQNFLQKPATPAQLLEIIRRSLDR
jgi:two-component system cell cycle sensor histidine kinase/response regulator CckA